jgi:hypothetical protein
MHINKGMPLEHPQKYGYKRIGVMKRKDIELITLSLMGDDVDSLHEERNEVNDS